MSKIEDIGIPIDDKYSHDVRLYDRLGNFTYIHPAEARKLLSQKQVDVIGYKPYILMYQDIYRNRRINGHYDANFDLAVFLSKRDRLNAPLRIAGELDIPIIGSVSDPDNFEIPNVKLTDRYGTDVFITKSMAQKLVQEGKIEQREDVPSHYKYKDSYPYRIMNSNDPMFNWDEYDKVRDAIERDIMIVDVSDKNNKMPEATGPAINTGENTMNISTMDSIESTETMNGEPTAQTERFDIKPLPHFPEPTDDMKRGAGETIKGEMRVATESEEIASNSEISNRHKYVKNVQIKVIPGVNTGYEFTIDYEGRIHRGEYFRTRLFVKLDLVVFRDETMFRDGKWHTYKVEGWRAQYSATYQQWFIERQYREEGAVTRNEDAIWGSTNNGHPMEILNELMEVDPRILMNIQKLRGEHY